MKRLKSTRPSPAMAVALLALFVALGGVSYAATQLSKNSVGARQLKRNSVNGVKVKDRSLTASDFRPGVLHLEPEPGISGYLRVSQDIPPSPANSHSGTASCPPGKIVLGGGAYLFSGEGEVVIDESYPNSNTSYYAQSLTVFAICADALPAG
jgi:hypothetical protein